MSYWVVTYQRENNGQTFWNCTWSGLRSKKQNAIGKTDEKWRTAIGALVPPLHWFHQDQDWWRLHQTNNQTWFHIKTSQCQYKVSATWLKISVLRKCGILASLRGANKCKRLNHFWPNNNTCRNFWLTPIMLKAHILEPQLRRKVPRLRSDVKRKKTIKSNNKNLFRIFTCRNLDVYLDNFGCLLVEMSFIGDWSGPPVWKISLQNEENAKWPFESTPLM